MTVHRGQLPKVALQIGEAYELSREDLLCLREKRNVPAISRLRDPHHRLARLIAMGIRPKDAAEECGFSIARVYTLHSDPSFKDLVASYRKDVNAEFRDEIADHVNQLKKARAVGLRHMLERAELKEEEGELLSFVDAHKLFEVGEDRVGVPKKSTSFNINGNFAANLELELKAAKERSAKIIDHEPSPKPLP